MTNRRDQQEVPVEGRTELISTLNIDRSVLCVVCVCVCVCVYILGRMYLFICFKHSFGTGIKVIKLYELCH